MAKNDDTPSTEDRLIQALEILAANNSSARNEELMITLTKAMERISETSLAGSKMIADETRRAHRPSNEQVPNTSVFNRRGVLLSDYEKPKLKCLMMMPWLLEWESMTREEVELANLLEPGEYALVRMDNSPIRVNIQADYKVDGVTMSRLVLHSDTGFNNDNFRTHRPFPEILRSLLKQHSPEMRAKAAGVMTDEEEEALIEIGQLSVSK